MYWAHIQHFKLAMPLLRRAKNDLVFGLAIQMPVGQHGLDLQAFLQFLKMVTGSKRIAKMFAN
jgi:hypothetical protein